ncbi:unnamed protein product [Moneuplotes crassus]|uniref:Phosphatidylinositol 3-kinase n=2 Tax=Euplotes crassus TaxID=5936 RepID=A0AAD1X905_EUPCR|nr:unnamed protein product [Moneuplotes crassus]
MRKSQVDELHEERQTSTKGISFAFETTEDYFDNYLDQCIQNERSKVAQENKEIKEERKMSEAVKIKIIPDEEPDSPDTESEDDPEESKYQSKKIQIIKKFLKLKSYRPDGACQNEIEDKYETREMVIADSPTKRPKEKKFPFMVCMDPDMKQFYRINLKTLEWNYEIIPDKELGDSLRQRAINTLRVIKLITNSSEQRKFYWKYQSEAEYFKVRKFIKPDQGEEEDTNDEFESIFSHKAEIPFKALLNREISEYPVKIVQEGDPNYCDAYDKMIFFQVDTSEYDDILSTSLGSRFGSKLLGVTCSCDAKALDLITEVKKKILQTHKIELTSRDESKGLAVKFSGASDYILGSYSLKQYRKINIELWKATPIVQIMITEVPINQKDRNFPPLYFMRPGTEFNFKKLQNSSLMYLYPPKKEEMKVNPLEQPLDCVYKNEDDEKVLKQLPSFLNQDRNLRYFKTRNSILKRRVKSSPLKSSQLLSPFRFKLVGFDRLWTVFDCLLYKDTEKMQQEMDRNNFMLQPQFLKPLKDKESFILDSCVSKSILSRYLEDSTTKLKDFCSNFNNFGCNYDKNYVFKILEFEDKSYVPVKMYLKCHLYHGSQLLSNPVYTKKVYYSNNTRINQWIQFGDIRYCDLPRNAKICIDIVCETIEPKHYKHDTQKRLSNINIRESNAFDINKIYMKGIDLYIGSVSFNLFDHTGKFKNSSTEFNVWPFYTHDAQLGCMKEYHGVSAKIFKAKAKKREECHSRLFLEFEKFHKNVYHEIRKIQSDCHFVHFSDENIKEEDEQYLMPKDITMMDTLKPKKVSKGDIDFCKTTILKNPIQELTDQQKRFLFLCRYKFVKTSRNLPTFLKCIDWTNPFQITEGHELLNQWKQMNPENALYLLGDKFSDKVIRDYAISLLSELSEEKFYFYTPQLTQALVYEDYHSSALCDLLLKRALECPYSIGHAFFWYLKSNLHVVITYERYSLIIEQFCMMCGRYLNHLTTEIRVNNLLADVSGQVKELKTTEKMKKKEIRGLAIEMLHEGTTLLPSTFRLTIDNEILCTGFNDRGFNIFSSKKMPLLLELKNADVNAPPIRTIFKNGDDLRQDMLTLQAIKLIDEIWKENGLDLCLAPYQVIGTGFEQGFLEFVGDSVTIAEIQYKKSIWNTFSENSIKNFLVQNFKERLKDTPHKVHSELKRVHENFIKSTAGYCVISYVLGLGDRHPDNIMVNKNDGNLFHIDFGHFLGNIKKKYGIKRERDPFVFTKEMAKFIKTDVHKLISAVEGKKRKNSNQNYPYLDIEENDVLGMRKVDSNGRASAIYKESAFDEIFGSKLKNECVDDNFYTFIKLCCDSFNILRKNSRRLINLFSLMTSAGMPELYKDEHIEYLVNALVLEYTDAEASVLFQKEIKKALATWSRRVDNFIHNVKAKYL